jgi:hypothetical protein
LTLALAWALLPVVLLALSWGCGRLVATLAGLELEPSLLLPTGFALVMAAGLFPPILSGLAPLATPLVVGLAITGFAVGRPIKPRLDRWAAAAGSGVFLVFGAPVLMSGRATFAGYVKLDDTATYLAMLDRFMGHGYNTAGLPPSTYMETLTTSLAFGYPMGSLVPLGIGHEIVRTDSAWLWQPYLTFLAAMLALALYGLVAPIVRSRAWRAAAAFVAAQAALLYGYVLWGGIKEVAAALLLALGCALIPAVLEARRARETLPLAVVGAAFVGALSAGGALWIVPGGIVAVVWAMVRGGRRLGVLAPALLGTTVVLAIPTLVAAKHWLKHASGFEKGSELANLLHPLDVLQVAGIWPTGDFRTGPTHVYVTHILIVFATLATLAGIAVAVRARAFGVLMYLLSALAGAYLFDLLGSPWIAGKGLATASPAMLVVGLGAAGAAASTRRRPALLALVAVPIAAGVLWSNMLAYHDVWLAPNARLSELETIGKHFAGDGPTLMTEYDSYGARHFLRAMDPEGASELRLREDPLRSGALLVTGDSADVDEFSLSTLLPYRALVLRRSPVESRPPSAYRLVWQGSYYEVWEQVPNRMAGIVEHIQLGNRFHAAAVPSCSEVLSVARAAGSGGKVVTVERPTNAALSLTGNARFQIGPYGERSDTIYLDGRKTITKRFDVSGGGRVEIGLDGSVQGTLSASVDGRKAGAVRSELNWPNEFQRIGSITLAPGRHTIVLSYSGSSWLPGTEGVPAFGAGPLIVGSGAPIPPLRTVPAADAQSLCGKSLDWLEAVRG